MMPQLVNMLELEGLCPLAGSESFLTFENGEDPLIIRGEVAMITAMGQDVVASLDKTH